MNVLHLSTYDLNGGAALAAFRLHQAMLKRRPEYTSSMLVLGKRSEDKSVIKLGFSSSITSRVKRRLACSQLNRDRAPYAGALSQAELFSDDRGAWTESIAENVRG